MSPTVAPDQDNSLRKCRTVHSPNDSSQNFTTPSATAAVLADGDNEISPPAKVDSSTHSQSSKDWYTLQIEISDVLIAKAAKCLKDRAIPIVEYGDQLQRRYGSPLVLQVRPMDHSLPLAILVTGIFPDSRVCSARRTVTPRVSDSRREWVPYRWSFLHNG
jgi:hypothetical protein